ncbi:hypothetical protein [uncultured Dubosiella sp.]
MTGCSCTCPAFKTSATCSHTQERQEIWYFNKKKRERQL